MSFSDWSEPSTSTTQWLQPCRKFKLREILSATGNFNESFMIGKGGFGNVYKGEVIVGTSRITAAIKRLDLKSHQGAAEFWAEVEMLSNLRHSHLVSLIGYCHYEGEMILVYEYMLNGTLEDHLHKLRTRLSWVDRLKICIGAARGLDYLHSGTSIEFGVIHRDVKTSNILLNQSWVAKISDFGLSRIGPTNQPHTYVNTLVKGTFGYFDPNYFATGQLTRKSDVYAFGVVLFEVLCQKRPVDKSLQWGLATWALDSIKEGNLKHIVDPNIRGELSSKGLKEFARIAERCVNNHPKHRPTMNEVISSLESILTLEQKINKSWQSPGKSIFTRMIDVFHFHSNGENSITTSDHEKKNKPTAPSSGEHVPTSEIIVTPNLKSFTFADLKMATRNFRRDAMLGEDGFGKIFKGWVDGKTLAPSKVGVGMPVSVKKSNPDGEGLKWWEAEVKFLGKFSHPNIVRLVGYCSEDRDFLLVYEFMQKGSLENHLFRRGLYVKPLAWDTRIKIATGAAQGLVFLHNAEEMVIHRDFSSTNILLDEEFNAKLSDFGLAKIGPSNGESHVTTIFVGTNGYAAPEYIATGRLYITSNVYSFGVVLLEIITGQRVVDNNRPTSRHNLVEWARPSLSNRRKVRGIIDARLEENFPLKGAYRTAQLIFKCLEPHPKNRPSMKEVLVSLQEIGSIKSKPKESKVHSR
uniref:probable serine/threonine-protein kinase PIX13 n=1 Tax=Erigeron canadensis TaxID=72917 RepID=UPI001CB8BBF5|nr:probable serine/threonine-protein kinase PIX13 [Erigeron canadensis]